MRGSLQSMCENFLENKKIIKKEFSWENNNIYPVCAAVFADKRCRADGEKLKECYRILKEQTGVFSGFRSTVKLPMVSLLAVDTNPENRMAETLDVYSRLKREFFDSQYLPLVAAVVSGSVRESEYEDVVSRTRRIYDMMKSNHRILTSGEDSIFAALLALSKMTDEQVVGEAEACYNILKQNFTDKNAVQSLSHALAMCEGNAEEKCSKTFELFKVLHERGCKYGTHYELSTLGVLAMMPAQIDEIADDVIEVADYLKGKEGYGFFGISEKQRIMHAGMLVASDRFDEKNDSVMVSTAMGATVALIIAQEIAILSAIVASSAASASTGS